METVLRHVEHKEVTGDSQHGPRADCAWHIQRPSLLGFQCLGMMEEHLISSAWTSAERLTLSHMKSFLQTGETWI